jgi:hypothetical protein
MKINITKTQRAKLVKDWLNDMFSDAEMMNGYYVKNGKKLAYFSINGGVYRQYKKFFFNYDTIWLFLESMFSLEYNELKAITEDWVEETLNLKGYTTFSSVHLN